MKQNEKFLVYAVTGFLVVILGVAILFGNEGQRRLPESVTPIVNASAPPSLEEVLNRRVAPQPEVASVGDDLSKLLGTGGEAGPAAPAAGESPAPAEPRATTDQPLVANVQLLPPSPAAQVTEKLGLSRREHDFRIVRARAGDSLGALVQKWCGTAGDYLEQAKGLNEELTTLRVGQEVVLPWVDDEALLAAFESRGPTHASDPVPAVQAPSVLAPTPGGAVEAAHAALTPISAAPAASTAAAAAAARRYKIKSGDSLWKIAEREVGRKQAKAFLDRVRELNPGLDADRIREGQEIVLPPKG